MKTIRRVLSNLLRALGLGVAVLLLTGLFFRGIYSAQAQAWSPSVSVYPGTNLDFGQAGSNEGEVQVSKTSSRGASFEIKAQLRGNQRILVEITTAEGERMVEYGGSSVSYDLRAAYNETADSRSGATEMTGSTVELDPSANQVKSGPGPPHRSAFVYVYGTANVGNVSSGTYSDEITLHAEIVGGPGDDDDFDDEDDDDDDDDDDNGDDDDDDDDDNDG